jgi:hypothetical protein
VVVIEKVIIDQKFDFGAFGGKWHQKMPSSYRLGVIDGYLDFQLKHVVSSIVTWGGFYLLGWEAKPAANFPIQITTNK